MKNHYQTFGLEEGASQEAIQEAYDRLCKELDPVNNDNQKFFIEEFEKLQVAYKVLRNSSILSVTSQTMEDSYTSVSTKIPKKHTIKLTKPEIKISKKLIFITIGILGLIILAIFFYQYSPHVTNRYFTQEESKMKSKDYRGAIADYTKTIKTNPNDRDAYYNRGYSKAKLQDHRGAIVDYTKAIALNPNDREAYNNRGNSKRMLQDYRGAIPDYTKAIEINPNYSDAYYNRGISIYKLQEDYQGALEDCTKAIQLNPNYSDAYTSRGAIKLSLNDKNGACLDWSKAGELGAEYAYDLIKKYCN